VAKLSLIEREKKRAHLVAKYAKKYAELKAAATESTFTFCWSGGSDRKSVRAAIRTPRRLSLN